MCYSEKLFKVHKVRIGLSKGQLLGKPYTRAFSYVCGERVSDGRHKLIRGKPVCIFCAEGFYYQINEE